MDSTGSVIVADSALPVTAIEDRIKQRVIVRMGLLLLICVLVALAFQWNRIMPLNGAWGWGGDEGQMIWNLWVVNWNVIHGHNPLVTKQVFYPHHTNLTHHSLASGYLPLTFITYLIYGHDPRYPLVALRLGTWLCYTLTLMLTYLVLRHLGYRRLESAIPALGFAFCGFNEHHLHLTVLSGWFIPLTALMVLRWWSKPTWQRMCAATFCFGVGVYFTEYSIFCALALLLATIILCCWRRGRRALMEHLRATGVLGTAAAFGLAMAIATPFIVNFVRADPVILPDFSEHVINSCDLFGIFVPLREWGSQPAVRLYGHLFDRLQTKLVNDSETFIGFPLMLLSLIALLRWRRNPKIVKGAAVLALIFYILMLGPRLHVLGHLTGFRLPYSLLIPIPPFNVQRAPLRLVVFLIFFLTIVAAEGAATIRDGLVRAEAAHRSTSRWHKIGGPAMLLGLLGWVIAESYNPHTPYPSYQPPPQLVRLMLPPGKPLTPLASLPIDSTLDGYSEMLQIYHHRPHITGYLARTTPKQLGIFQSLLYAYLQGPQSFARRVKLDGVDTVSVYWSSSDDVFNPSDTFLADLARQVNVVDFRPDRRKLVADAGCGTLFNGQPWDAAGTTRLKLNQSIVLRCDKPTKSDRIEFLGQSNAIFDIDLLSDGKTLCSFKAMPINEAPMTLQWRCFMFPESSFDSFRITLRAGPGDVTIGRIAVWAR